MEPGRHVDRISAVGDEPRFYAYNQNKLAIVPVRGRRATRAHRIPRSIGVITRMVAGRQERVRFSSRMTAPSTSLACRPAAAPSSRSRAAAASCGELSIGPDGKAAVLAATAAEPFEVHAIDGGQLRRLSAQNDEWLKPVQLASVEDFTAQAKDGTVVNGLLFKPPSFTRRHQVSDAAQHPRRPERAGRARVRLRGPVARGERLRRAAGQLSRQRRARVEVPEGHLRGLGASRGRRPARRRRLRGRAGHRRPRPPRHRRVELRRHPDELHDCDGRLASRPP